MSDSKTTDSSEPSPIGELRWDGMTHPGRFRKNNEDAFLALTFDALQVRYLGKSGESATETGDFVFAVSDGMGGAKSGEFASRIAVQKITELLPKSFNLGALGVDRGFSDILVELFQRIHKEMTQMSAYYEECRGMGATLSLGWFSPGMMHFCHIGDSRIYYLPSVGGLKQITEDHTHVGWLQRSGQINEREARNHPERNQLQQVLGGKCRQIAPQVGSVVVEPGDRFLFCSDGVMDGVWDRRIEELLRQPPPRFAELRPAERLIKDSMEESGRDNITALVVEVA
ncbi:protein phosphatase 2C domain-containing protein [Pelagicoccus sp. SDUM812003]|uniref:PP2C family protein-serine/threonine phosphatase n=1 Tax=Pelagicoccus sp. SDUM812003 TaxID=3041267 RepID=UPI00280E0CF9|nr:protein phosphatase 2C domain-containing protein [Pelagicoccus sp. SDUM812003]MDQ8205320.1 protein phosphatase 2C domain-containing protein [Pelagicoccus sp. SDUM812003]